VSCSKHAGCEKHPVGSVTGCTECNAICPEYLRDAIRREETRLMLRATFDTRPITRLKEQLRNLEGGK
jgi:hypothetical protein